jgi:hypothetical protein
MNSAERLDRPVGQSQSHQMIMRALFPSPSIVY